MEVEISLVEMKLRKYNDELENAHRELDFMYRGLQK